MLTTKIGIDASNPDWKCEPGPGFRMPGDLLVPDGFWDKTGPTSYLKACKTRPGQKWWMVETGIVGQAPEKKFLVPCAAIYGLVGNREYLIKGIPVNRTNPVSSENSSLENPALIAGVAILVLLFLGAASSNSSQQQQPYDWQKQRDQTCRSLAVGQLFGGGGDTGFTQTMKSVARCPW